MRRGAGGPDLRFHRTRRCAGALRQRARQQVVGSAGRDAPSLTWTARAHSFPAMKRVTGSGGIFIKSADPARLREWYQKHLGIPVEAWGGTAFQGPGTTVWNVFEAASNYFDPSQAQFMVNYRVADLRALI